VGSGSQPSREASTNLISDLRVNENRSQESADGRVATEAAWLNGKNGRNCGKSRKTIDRNRPSHGRTLAPFRPIIG
jgi:hypothetical protein